MKEKDFDRIEQFIRNEMNADEQKDFEQDLAQDEALRQELALQQDIAKVVAWQGIMEEADQELATTDQGEKVVHIQREPRAVKNRRIFAYAAAVGLLLIAGSIWWANLNYSPDRLASLGEARLNLDQTTSGSRTGDPATKDAFAAGIAAMQAENWSAASEFFQSITDTVAVYSEAQLMIAYIQLRQKQYDRAIKQAELVISKSIDTRHRQKAQWIQAQALIFIPQRRAQLEALLHTIQQDEGHMFRAEAEELRHKLESPWRKLVL